MMFSTTSAARASLLATLLAIGLGACGSSSHHSTHASPPATATRPSSGPTGGAPVQAKPTGPVIAPLRGPVVSHSAAGMTASLHADNHAPVIGKAWHYSVEATAGRHALPGTVETEFVYNGMVVGRETPPVHKLKRGRLNDNVTFPANSLGASLTFQTMVKTPLGTVTLDWPIKPTKGTS